MEHRASSSASAFSQRERRGRIQPQGLTVPLVATAISVALIATLHWARRWLYSGCAIQSLITVYGESSGNRIFSSIPLWTLLATLNLVYSICSTSWLLYAAFSALCYFSIFITCLFQFTAAAGFARRVLRKLLRQLHFTRDKIALFNLPALEIDTDVSGLFVMRGVSISLSTLTIAVHGIEVGIVFPDDLELAMYVDKVTIALFRRIQIGEVYANIKGGKVEMSFADLAEAQNEAPANDGVFESTPLLRAATAGSQGFNDRRPMLHKVLTGSTYMRKMRDSSPKASLASVKTLSPDDENAEKQYDKLVNEILTTSAVYQSRRRVREQEKAKSELSLDDNHDLRAAICTDLHDLPAIPHPPTRSIRVTTLQNLMPLAVRTFMHRLPFLLRLLLGPLGYLHDINMSAIIAGGSGRWTSSLLAQKVFKHYSTASADIRRLEKRIALWLDNANFGLQLDNIDARAEIPLSTSFDIMASLKVKDIIVYRTVLETGTIAKVARLGGADATVTIPSYLLPHHEHIIPPPPTKEDEEDLRITVETADSIPQKVQDQERLERMVKDEANITISVHVSLPAVFDQSLLDFIAALVKATKIIEMVNDAADDSDADALSEADVSTGYDTPVNDSATDLTTSDAPTSPSKKFSSAKVKSLTTSLKANLKSTTASFSDFHNSNRESFKKAMVGGLVNDRWIAKVVGKVAGKLEESRGDLGWSGSLPVPLEGYRSAWAEMGEGGKILP